VPVSISKATTLVGGVGTDGTVIDVGTVGVIVSSLADGNVRVEFAIPDLDESTTGNWVWASFSPDQIESRVLTEREVAETYLDYVENGRHADQWVSTVVSDLSLGVVADDASLWSLLVLLVELAPDARVLSRIGAGPLEDLLNRADEQWLVIVESEARRSPRMREALANVWGEGATFDRIRSLP
jgi:hypothetical protein